MIADPTRGQPEGDVTWVVWLVSLTTTSISPLVTPGERGRVVEGVTLVEIKGGVTACRKRWGYNLLHLTETEASNSSVSRASSCCRRFLVMAWSRLQTIFSTNESPS
eukprot:sb/3477680/